MVCTWDYVRQKLVLSSVRLQTWQVIYIDYAKPPNVVKIIYYEFDVDILDRATTLVKATELREFVKSSVMLLELDSNEKQNMQTKKQ